MSLSSHLEYLSPSKVFEGLKTRALPCTWTAKVLVLINNRADGLNRDDTTVLGG